MFSVCLVSKGTTVEQHSNFILCHDCNILLLPALLGKSTQVPQFLLDANPGCCIAVTQPRRISAISIAERIAEEQCLVGGVGGLVGYQVRLDSAISNDTQLAFMTPGILLRKMQSAPQLTEYTHIVVDEIHERDKYQEFLLIVLRDLLAIRPDLRIILMSATLQTDTLVDYFESYGIQPAVIEMEGKMFPVQEYFLENVLEMTGYIDASTAVDGAKQLQLEQELAKLTGQTQSKRNQQQQQQQQQVANVSMQCAMCGRQNFASADELGEHIVECDGFFDADEDNAIAVKEKAATVNSLASTTSALLDLSRSDDGDVVKWDGEPQLVTNSSTQITALQQKLLDKYQTIHDDEDIDNNLLLEIVRYIVKSSYGDGGILIFLPGWKEISEFSRLLENTAPFYDETKFMILPLHSGIPSREQRRVLQWPPKGVRKIVLSTNIAETSLTIEDCVFVIGKLLTIKSVPIK